MPIYRHPFDWYVIMSSPTCLSVFLLVVMLVAQPLNTQAGVQDTITALNTQYVNAINQDNVNSVMELYDNDCVMMLEGFETISGKSRTQPYVAKMIGDVTTVTFTSQEVTPMDDAADYVYQRSKFSGQNANGKVVYDGKSLMIWKKNDSSYKIHIHMYNSDS